MPLLEPPELPPLEGRLDPVALDAGCVLGCDTELLAGRVPVPFGHADDRSGRQRMSEAEAAALSQGLPLDRGGTGVAARLAPADRWSIDTALVLPGTRNVERLAARGPSPPDVAARAAFDPGLVAVGASVFVSGFDDRAVAVDLQLDAGHWTIATEVARQRIGDVKRAFDEEVRAPRVTGDGASVRVERALGAGFTAGTSFGGRTFFAGDALALPPFVRSVAGLEYVAARRVRWTVLELADTELLGPADDDLRVATRIEVGRNP